LVAIATAYVADERGEVGVDGSDVSAFVRILATPGLHLFVLELDGVVVEESLRGTGLGEQIMDGTLQAAWKAGCYKATLMTGSSRPGTHAFYRACGFSSDAKTAYLARPS
jgi:GNAT superfamily N-acetyltransferase